MVSDSPHNVYRYNLESKKPEFLLNFHCISIYRQTKNDRIKETMFDWVGVSDCKLVCLIYLDVEKEGFEGKFHNIHINPYKFNPKHLGTNYINISENFNNGEGICLATETFLNIFENDIYIYPGCMLHSIGPTLRDNGRLVLLLGLN